MDHETRLAQSGLELPQLPEPVGAYVPTVRTGNLIFTAGQLPFKDGKLTAAGKVPADVPLEAARAAALQACLNALAAVRRELGGSLNGVRRIVRMNVLVNSAAGFTDQPKVANAASDALATIFGDAGRHTRTAVGAAELPLNAPVELDLIVEVA